MMIKITPFGGLFPRTSPRLLSDNSATVANNVKLQSGDIKPLREPGVVNVPNKPMPALSVFRARYLDEAAWCSWTDDVDMVRVPLSADVEARFVWTGDGIPKIATYKQLTSSGNNDYPSTEYALGVAPPVTKATVSPSGGSGAATTRVYTYTFFSALGEESSPAPVSSLVTGKVDDSWVISGMDTLPVNTGNITDVTYTGKDVTITTSDQHFNRVGEEITVSGITTVSNVDGTWTLKAVSQTAKTMTFTVTDTPTGTYDNGTDSADTWTRTVPFYTTGMKRRLYRSTGLTGTVQLVHDDVGTSYTDTLLDSQILGDELISSGWVQPPVGLRGVCVHSSGALVGFVGNLVCFSEPYQPHAWPEAYQLSTDREIVAIGTFASEVGIGTKGLPWIASGVEPASMTMEKVNALYPCLSKRSMIAYGDGLLYASSHGLIYAGASGVNIVSDKFYTRDEWTKLNPATMVLSTAYGRIYIAMQREDGVNSMLVIDGDVLVTADINVSELYTDEATNELYVTDNEGIKIWDSPDTFQLNAAWRSKEFVLPAPVNFGAAKIEFDSAIDPEVQQAIENGIAAAIAFNAALLTAGDIQGSFNAFGYNERVVHKSALRSIPDNPPSNEITFMVYRDGGTLVCSRTVRSNKAFRLPSGYKSDTFSVEVFGQCRIKEIRISETMDGLRNA